jgi:hypothetical protein
MDRTAAGKALEGKKYRRGSMLTKEALLEFAPGQVVFVVASSLGQQAFVANEPMVLNSVDDKAATFLSERERVVFRLKDKDGRSHVSACWAIHDGHDVRLYDAVQVG